MYCVSVMYPNETGSAFKLQHYLDVHMPMGVGLLHKHFGIKPARIEVFHDTYGPDRTNASAAYHCFGNVYFEKKEDVDRFIELFEMKEPTALLKADWPKYTPKDPIAVVAKVTVLDPDDVVSRGPKVIETAEAELRAAE